MATKCDLKDHLGYLLVETAPGPVDELPAEIEDDSHGCSICRRAGAGATFVEAPPANELPLHVEDGSHGCSICKRITASYDAGGRHVHVDASPDLRLPDDLDVSVVVGGPDGVHRHFAPPPEALLALERYRSADWYLPVPVPGLTRVALALSYTEDGSRSAGEIVAAMR